MSVSWAAIIVAFAPLAVIAALLSVALWSHARGQRTDGDAATCGSCGYLMRSISSFECPECGADLREVGMTPSRHSPNRNQTIAALIVFCVVFSLVSLLLFWLLN